MHGTVRPAAFSRARPRDRGDALGHQVDDPVHLDGRDHQAFRGHQDDPGQPDAPWAYPASGLPLVDAAVDKSVDRARWTESLVPVEHLVLADRHRDHLWTDQRGGQDAGSAKQEAHQCREAQGASFEELAGGVAHPVSSDAWVDLER